MSSNFWWAHIAGPRLGNTRCSEQPVSLGPEVSSRCQELSKVPARRQQRIRCLRFVTRPTCLVPPRVKAGSEEEIRPDQSPRLYHQTAKSDSEGKQQTSTQSWAEKEIRSDSEQQIKKISDSRADSIYGPDTAIRWTTSRAGRWWQVAFLHFCPEVSQEPSCFINQLPASLHEHAGSWETYREDPASYMLGSPKAALSSGKRDF